MTDRQPEIGVFDSGVGGLTVLRALIRHLPREHTIYLGDTARVPYGAKSPDIIIRYALGVADYMSHFPLKALVVACNTASSVALPALRKKLNIPVIGVVEPGARAAVAGGKAKNIAVLATRGTVASGAYERSLRDLDRRLVVTAVPCPLFVPLAEEGLCQGPIVDSICHHYLDSLRDQVDTVILGCTHFPLLAKPISDCLGADVRVVDGGQATAVELAQVLAHQLAPRTQQARHRFAFTDAAANTAALCGRFLGQPVDQIEVVDL